MQISEEARDIYRPATMKAVAKIEAEPGINVIDSPRPRIKPNEAVVRMEAVGICGTDLNTYRWGRTVRPMSLPRIIGHEGCGTVAEIGHEAANVQVGERVVFDTWGGCGFCRNCRTGQSNICETEYRLGTHRDGCMAEYVAIPVRDLYHLPDSISFEEGALLEPFTVSLHAVEISRLKLGDNAVVIGPGPIGMLAAIAAKAAGAARVLIAGLNVDKGRLEAAASLGFIPLDVERENARQKVMEATDGRGADVVFECASGSWDQAMALVRRGGEIVAAGLGQGPSPLDSSKLIRKNLTITAQYARTPSTWYRVLNLVATRTVNIKPVISHVMPLTDAPKAFEMLDKKQALKVILKP